MGRETTKKFKPHPAAEIFPMMSESELHELADDIGANGQKVKIAVWASESDEGFLVLDGRNRIAACELLGIDPQFEIVEKNIDPFKLVVSANLRRRHLDESQRSMVATRLATIGHGGDRSKAPVGALTQEAAAELLNVSERSVQRAKSVREHGSEDVVRAVESGDLPVFAGEQISKLPKKEQTGELEKALAGKRGKRSTTAKARSKEKRFDKVESTASFERQATIVVEDWLDNDEDPAELLTALGKVIEVAKKPKAGSKAKQPKSRTRSQSASRANPPKLLPASGDPENDGAATISQVAEAAAE
jgi:ParB-like chromosome segregation protein Spo0J